MKSNYIYMNFIFFLTEGKQCCQYKHKYFNIFWDRTAVVSENLTKHINEVRRRKQGALNVERLSIRWLM